MSYLHLAPGTSVVPHGDGLLLATADERFAAISGAPAELLDLREILRGARPVPGSGIGAEVTDAAVSWGAGRLAAEPLTPPAPWRMSTILPTEELAAAVGAVQLVVADVLDDAALCRMDQAQTTPWLPVHRELGAVVAGPVLGGPAATLSWADVRFRRLAASPARPQLAALWETWTKHGTTYDVLPSTEAVHAAATKLVDRVREDPAILLTHQVVAPCDATAVPTAHPVLPVPAGLMAQVPA